MLSLSMRLPRKSRGKTRTLHPSLQENHSFATNFSVANPLQISISNGFATEVFCCKNLVAILHTLAFGCKRPMDLQRNYSVVILQRISHPLLIQLLNPKNQKTMNKLKLLSFRCKFATDQQQINSATDLQQL